MNGHGNILDLFLNRGARIDIVNMGGDTPLHVAAAWGKYDTVMKVGIEWRPETGFSLVQVVRENLINEARDRM